MPQTKTQRKTTPPKTSRRPFIWENRNKKQTYAIVAAVAAKYPNLKLKHKILGIDQNDQIKRPCLVAIAEGNSFYTL